ncbi:BNR repeat-containing protein [Mucilaginibacter boryungensis]|uniref:BNR repeat-containing protein n=1 Tax=Mucilaginibacter boryungensis TaxID=768480 RepID=A0ABR9XEF7_9SPHI|nr:BNR repeat-containing protein [Mucilaginibacter boryungensis]MBE9665774.1 BNR repeat-containing protein [Mucilaginibacter boryungensis]
MAFYLSLTVYRKTTLLLAALITLASFSLKGQISTISTNGWANNSVNTVIFRKNSLVTWQNIQYAAYYDQDQYVVLAKRKTGETTWQNQRTPYKGDATDAHKSISIIIDGDGYLHVTWGQHNNPLNYAVSTKPGSLQLGEKQGMTGNKENKVSYPEFYKLPAGDILFLYRDGASGNGNLMLNRYVLTQKKWIRVQDGMIDGEGQRNAYWQMSIDIKGIIHLSWVWRESPDVASNHDMCYARSVDGGVTWQKSNGEKYTLPINAANAEYACKIPHQSELINQTSMFADAAGHPFIATYWREAGQTVPQYHLIYHDGKAWRVNNLGFRKTPFTLSGAGTKSIPVSRPQIIAWKNGARQAVAFIFRDAERGNKISIAVTNNVLKGAWQLSDISNNPVGAWEPTYDTELWKNKGVLDLFVQPVIQIDGEGKGNVKPQPVTVLEWKTQAIIKSKKIK